MRNQGAIRRTLAACGHALVVAVSILACAGPADAGLTQFSSFRVGDFTQTGNSTTAVSNWFINERAFVDNLGDFASITVTDPGAPFTLAPVPGSNPPFWSEPGVTFPTLAALNAAFPTGTYTVTGTPTNGVSTLSLSYTQDAYAGSVPLVTNFSSLAGLDPTKAFTFNLNPFTPSPVANESDLFFSITNTTTNQTVFSQSFLPATTSSVVLPANTLLSNTAYAFDLIFSDRIDSPSPTSFTTVQGFDLSTSGLFTTGTATAAVPEPSTFALGLSAAMIGLGARCYRRRRPVTQSF